MTDALRGERLSPREWQILALVASGISVKQIADEIGFDASTVSNRIKRILAKLGLRNRVQAALHFHSIDMDETLAFARENWGAPTREKGQAA